MALLVTSLTAEQRAALPAVAARYIEKGLSTAPADRAKVESGIRRCYALAGLKEPAAIVWVKSPIVGAFAAPIAAQVIKGADVRSAVRSAVGSAVDSAVGSAVRSAVGSAVDSAVGSAVRSDWYRYLGGRWWLSYQAWLRALEDVAGWKPDADIQARIDAYEDAQGAGWWWPFDTFCIVCDAPTVLNMNADGRLHCEDGPAISWGDEWSLWFLNGQPVTQQVVEKPETMTFELVRDERNAEVRRFMLDRFGGLRGSRAAGAWLSAGNLKPISEVDITDKMQPSGLSIWKLSNGDAPVLCKLYRAEMEDDEPLVLIMVVCTSTAKQVFLRVPPDMTDAATARDWTFRGVRLADAIET